MPYPINKLAFNLEKERNAIEAIIKKIGAIYDISKIAQSIQGRSCGGAALYSAINALRDIGGKVLLFTNEAFALGIGCLPLRDNSLIYGTEKEKSLKTPSQFYIELANSCIKDKIAVDVFSCSPTSIDLASIGSLCNLTGGEVYHYQNFNALFGEKLYYDLFRNLTRNYGFDAAFTVRTSIGLRTGDYYGGFFTKSDKIIELPSIDSDKTIGVSIQSEGKLIPDTDLYVQFALLYTTMSGERRIRVINNVLTATSNPQALYTYIDGEATLNLMIKQNIINLIKSSVTEVKEKLINDLCHILYYYRVFVSQSAHSSQLVLPESLKYTSLYLLGLFKLPALMNLKDTKLDECISSMDFLLSCNLPQLIMRLYPKVYQITNVIDPKSNVDIEGVVLKPQNVCSIKEKLQKQEAYLFDNGQFIYIFVYSETNIDFVQQV